MASKDDFFPSKYLKQADLDQSGVVVTICEWVPESVKDLQRGGERTLPMLNFEELEKGLLLNKTNYEAIEFIFKSGDPDDWVGKQIDIYPTMTQMNGKPTPCIRVRPVRQATQGKQYSPKEAVAKKAAASLPDDEIPF
jgi:hypothetical protein